MGSARKHERARGKDRDSKTVPGHPTPLIAKVCGCPVPEPIHCFVGKPLPLGGDGVRMECSNEKCPFADVLLHQRCFEAFEDHLIKVLSNLGSARGWTEAQRRANLWDKKGQSLIAKVCRCRCGLGMTRMDEQAAYERLKRKTLEEAEALREAALAAGLPTPSPKKKHKNKNVLPKLNFGVVKAAPRPHAEEREARAMLRKQGQRVRDVSTSSMSSSPTSYLAFESRRESFTYASDVWGLLPAFPDNRTPSVVSGNTGDHEDTISSSSKIDFQQECSNNTELIPAPLPPRQVMSYASAMKHRGSSTNEQITRHSITSPISIKTYIERDNDMEIKSGSTSSDYSGPVKGTTSSLKDCAMMSFQFNRTEDEAFSDCSLSTDPLGRLSSLSDEETAPRQWHLFSGTTFALGEMLVAHRFLPIWNALRRTKLPTKL